MINQEAKKKILIADNEALNLEFFEVMLPNLGFEMRSAKDGVEAAELLSKWKPDLLILDNVLPRISGWELTKLIRTSQEFSDISDIPIIMLSEMDDVKDKVEGLESGADDYITKPFNFTEVLARIRAFFRTRELVGQIEHREGRIRLAEDISERTLTYLDSLRAPLANLLKEAELLLPECEEATAFVELARNELRSALAGLDLLDSALSPLMAEKETLKAKVTDLHILRKSLKGSVITQKQE
jgi:DNA-binding response OmpR family regulator